MNNIYNGIIENDTLRVAFLAWLIAQILKFIFNLFSNKKIDITRLLGSGGMPSSHSALVTSLSVYVGRMQGWTSSLFAVTLIFAFVVMYDAAGVRRASGKQAEVLNQIINDIYHGTQISQEKLKELIGHTPIEVLAGSVLGIFIGSIF
ncbi:MAG: divergent PAP2 family protein [Clostridia bacterium]|nr:divergent PAP2 family protein [Clostridia bacterium]MDD4048872.1 divergent PAP2 family protein [Clostridia bacterium]